MLEILQSLTPLIRIHILEHFHFLLLHHKVTANWCQAKSRHISERLLHAINQINL